MSTSKQLSIGPRTDDWWEAIDTHDMEQLEELLATATEQELAHAGLVAAALHEDCLPAVSLLLEHGANATGATVPIICKNDPPLLRTHLANKGTIDERDTFGCQPLHVLANRLFFSGGLNEMMASWLIASEEDPNDPETLKRLELLSVLLEAGADPNAPIEAPGDPSKGLFIGATALDIAAQSGSHALYYALEKAGARAGAIQDQRVLFFLLERQHPAGISAFIEQYEQFEHPLSFTNEQGDGLLQFAIKHHRFFEAEWLLKQGADPNATHHSATPPLHYAIYQLTQEKRTLEMLRLLLDVGADPNLTPAGQLSPLCLLLSLGAEVEHLEKTAALLLEYGAKAGASDTNETITPLLLAATQADLPWSIFETLIEHGADPQEQRGGRSPLHLMMLRELPPEKESVRIDNVKHLLSLGVDLNTPTSAPIREQGRVIPEGATALDIAGFNGHQELFEALTALGAELGVLQELGEDNEAGHAAIQYAGSLLSQGSTDEAIEHLTVHLIGHPDDIEVRLQKGIFHFQLGEFADAIEDWNKVEAQAADRVAEDFYAMKGAAYLQLHAFKDALEAFHKIPEGHHLHQEIADFRQLAEDGLKG